MTDKYPGLPLYLLGHSMGGMVAIESVLLAPTLFDVRIKCNILSGKCYYCLYDLLLIFRV